MNNRERVLNAINHKPVDRTPTDFLGEPWMRTKLTDFLKTETFDEALIALDVDIRQISQEDFAPAPDRESDGSYIDIWGIKRKPVTNQFGSYDEVEFRPFASMTELSQVNDHPWPSPDIYDFTNLEEMCRRYHDNYAVVFGGPEIMDLVNGNSFGRGMEQMLMDIALEDPVGMALLDKRQEFFYTVAENGLKAANGLVDILWIGDDYGTQDGQMFSMEMWNLVFRPRLQSFIDLGHRYGVKVMLHSCGCNRALLPAWIDMGLDIYQAVQTASAEMQPAELFKEFGKDLTFHGMIDVQGVLPMGTPEEVIATAKTRIEASGGSGYILSPSHNFQPDIPIENVLALYKAQS